MTERFKVKMRVLSVSHHFVVIFFEMSCGFRDIHEQAANSLHVFDGNIFAFGTFGVLSS